MEMIEIKTIGGVLDSLKSAYPQFYAKQTDDDRKNAIKLWSVIFADDDDKLLYSAVYSYIATDNRGYPPAPGQIKSMLAKLVQGEQITELEAWSNVRRALCNCLYGSEAEYDSLDDVSKRCVGSPAQMREWAKMDTETLDSVVSSNFQRSYRAISAKNRETMAIPSKILAVINQTLEQKKLI